MANKSFTQFRVDNIVTTLPTTLAYGQEVYYKDANGNLTLWVGHEDGTAWPAVGYKEYVARILYTVGPLSVTVLKSDIGAVSWSRVDTGSFLGSLTGAFANNDLQESYSLLLTTFEDGEEQYVKTTVDNNNIQIANFIDQSPSDVLGTFVVRVRMFPS